MNISFKLRDLLEAGMHLGHKTNKWNPNMDKYIYGSQDSIHIIDLRKTFTLLNSALSFIDSTIKNNGLILFIGTKSQASDIVKKYAIECKQFYVNKRWLGGTLTNWKTISNSIKKLEELDLLLSDTNANLNLSKKELLNYSREKDKLFLNLGGIKNLISSVLLFIILKKSNLPGMDMFTNLLSMSTDKQTSDP